jgi:hypothetical protein
MTALMMNLVECNAVSSVEWTGKGLHINHLPYTFNRHIVRNVNHFSCLSQMDAVGIFTISSML